jgi:hypothetical protein
MAEDQPDEEVDLEEDDLAAIFAADEKRTRQYREGDYVLLEWGLATLRHTSHDWYEAVLIVYVNRELREIGDRLKGTADAAVDWLAARMREAIGDRHIRVPRWAATDLSAEARSALIRVRGRNNGADPEAVAQRNRLIRDIYDTGESDMAGLVRMTGMSRSQLSEVVFGRLA